MFTGASTGAPDRESARIDASDARVEVGEAVVLKGAFPGAADAPFEVRYRERGERRWTTLARGTTGASGRYKLRVRPRRSGYWRAELSSAPQTQATTADAAAEVQREPAVDGGTGSERIVVRSEVHARISKRNALVGDRLTIRGTVAPSGAERRVRVRVGKATRTVRAGRNGKFELDWNASSTGRYPVEVRARSNRIATGSRDSAGAITVYRPAAASWYGPGLYGNNLACGGTLTPSTIGVAHKTMPCGTKLRLRYRGRSVDVRVIDRGPFAGDREFDLTSATKQRLGFPDVGTVLTSR